MEETTVPTKNVSMMKTRRNLHTTVDSIPNGSFHSGSSVVDQTAEEPFVHVSGTTKTFKLIN